MSYMIMAVFLLLKFAYSSSPLDDFIFNGSTMKLDGTAKIDSKGLLMLTNSTSSRQTGHAFYNDAIQFKNSTNNGRVISFSTTFIFEIVQKYPSSDGHGMAFVISPSKEFRGARPAGYLGLFNDINTGSSSNHIVAVEMDTFKDVEFDDRDNNHVGIDINGLKSIISASAGYFPAGKNGTFKDLKLKNGDPMQVWVEYNGVEKQINVTLSPINVTKPDLPLISLRRDLSPVILDNMYVGFSTSTGRLTASDYYILAWSFKMNGEAEQIDLSRIPKTPQPSQEIDREPNAVLEVLFPFILFLVLLLVSLAGGLLISMKKFIDVLEDWEVQYGPHRFSYKDLSIATEGFEERKLLGRGGFGTVYRGVLPTLNTQVAVKRVAHDSRQGMREFVAEIATIGRLRHPNLVRLLGYSRHKQELLLVYDYMPNGSLDKFLYGQRKGMLNGMQRFKIIKDVASGLFYLHHQWVQVVIHRDIKASNVLIDSHFNARLGDFGLAKLCEHGTDPQTSHVAGTLGYIAPELARTGKANTNTDMFAFGTFMLEVVCGRRPVEPRASPEKIILIDWVFECLERGNILEAIDQSLGTEYVVEEAELVLKLGLLCSHAVAAARPSMSVVIKYLEGEAKLPDNLSEIIRSQDFGEASNGEDVPLISVPSATIREPFVSRGRCIT
ncbi:L-type lectin-domain containing receptor kinase V.9-like [Camellia sinensis]|uniref:L-type lectin-domain containing receptor kinase V.9-like n=1 Tax=Camellia sinensis TaxID=4442 RepID=UPI001036630A|nr:L-type lectin-domain containing receptor kinase V.9-like [Camellia sinensis]XP_028116507.1 L-type lectin-domain containing receptor kinase V.9-like [Camellia sinensis]XP_028116508.1 L-type lectin-domain containing receptor kinase V.9-like [Camellia sinensis]